MSTSKSSWFKYFVDSPARVLLIPILICLIFSSVLGFLIPVFTRDVYASYDQGDLYLHSLKLLLSCFVGVYFSKVTYEIIVARYIQKTLESIRTHCYEKWMGNQESMIEGEQNLQSRDRYPLGEVLARLMNDTEAIRELTSSGAFGIFIDFFFIAASLVSLAQLHARAGGILAVSELVSAVLLVLGSRSMAKVFFKVRQSNGYMSRTVANVTAGMSEIFYSNHHNYSSKKGLIAFKDFLRKQLKANIWDASYYSLAESLYPIFLLILAATVPWTQIRNAALIAVLIDLIQKSINPLKAISGKIANIQRAITGIKRIDEFISDLSNGMLTDSENKHEVVELDRLRVKVDKFAFTREDQESFVLQNIEFSGHKGELIGLVGASGSGKSTLLNIISGRIVPKLASIELYATEDQVNPKITFPESDHESYVRQVGIVSQDSHVFSQPLEFNITLEDNGSARFPQFWQEMLSQIPYLKTWGVTPEEVISPAGLSLGQKQLVCALRACFLRKPIVLFDEIASSLDSELEQSLRKTILLIQKNSLTLIVAHRVETVAQADKIVVLSNGEMVAKGKHQQLLDSDATYKEFIKEITHLT